MTTKPKTRKPAPKTTRRAPAPKAAIEPNGDYFHLATASISKLIARLRFLEAECRYHDEMSDEGYLQRQQRQKEERDLIMKRLGSLVPETFDEVRALLGFVTERIQAAAVKNAGNMADVTMLRNANAGIIKARVHKIVDSAMRQADEIIEVRKIFGGVDA